MADVEENMEEVAVEQEEQAVAEDTSKDEVAAAQSTTVGGVTMDEGMYLCIRYILVYLWTGSVRYSVCIFLQNLIIRHVFFILYTSANMIDTPYILTFIIVSTTSFGHRFSCKHYPSHRYRC